MTLLAIALSKPLFFSAFLILVFIGLALDLGAFAKQKPHSMPFREALWRTIGWVSAGLAFSLVIYVFYDDVCGFTNTQQLAAYKTQFGSHFQLSQSLEQTRNAFSTEIVLQYITGYFIEYSLSIDNLFVMMLIFSSFRVADEYRKNILFWGVLGAVIMRFIFIFAGSALLMHFHWLMYVFGAVLLFSGFKLLIKKEEDEESIDTENHKVVKLARRFLPVTDAPHNGRFTFRVNGKLVVSSLFIVLLVIEFTDVIFAVDSVPAIFGVTTDPYIVFFSNIFAIMGLRSLYFLLSHGLSKIRTLKYGLSLILIFIGFKMIFSSWFELIGFTHLHSLGVLVAIIAGTVFFAWYLPHTPAPPDSSNH